jgi:hypothetical protein
VEGWLEPRLVEVPESLRRRIIAAVRETGNGKREAGAADATLPVSPLVPETLKRAGENLLARARSGPASRETALTLLAADALMTFACEAMAELDPGGLAGAP